MGSPKLEHAMSDAVRIIKKYPNRRLYDTANSGYITLADVKQMVLENIEFETGRQVASISPEEFQRLLEAHLDLRAFKAKKGG